MANSLIVNVNETKFLLSMHNNAAGNMSQWMNATGVEIFTAVGATQSGAFSTIIMRQLMADFPMYKFRLGDGGKLYKESNFTVLTGNGYTSALLE
jgi:hypothetical protein